MNNAQRTGLRNLGARIQAGKGSSSANGGWGSQTIPSKGMSKIKGAASPDAISKLNPSGKLKARNTIAKKGITKNYSK